MKDWYPNKFLCVWLRKQVVVEHSIILMKRSHSPHFSINSTAVLGIYSYNMELYPQSRKTGEKSQTPAIILCPHLILKPEILHLLLLCQLLSSDVCVSFSLWTMEVTQATKEKSQLPSLAC